MLDSLLNSAPIGIYVVDSDFRLFLVNSVARDIFGAATRWIGRPIDELIHTLWPNPYADSFLERLRRTLDTGEPDAHPEHTERRLDRPRTEHYEWQLARIEFAPGHHGVACYFRDISVQVKNYRELERQREALRAGNERLELAQSATGVGFFDWDIVHDTSHVSPEWMRIYGLDPKAAAPTHATWRECVHPDDRDAATAAALAAVQRGAPFEQEFRVLWPDGSSHWVESRGRTLFDAQGTPQRFIGTAIDVTARKATEQALVDSEQRFQVALRHTPLTMYATDRELRCTWIHNPALGVDAVALLGKRDEEVLPFAEVAPFVEIKRRVLGSGVGERRQVATRVGGVDYAFHVSIEPQRDAQGNIVGLIGAAMDVSEFVRAKEQAEAASKAKDEFLAVLSQELRTPLAPVLASAELLERDDLEPAQRRELAQVIRRNAELEARLIDDLLDVTRIANDKLELRLAAVDLHECIESVLSICRADAAAKDIAMAANFHAHDHRVRADHARLQQVIWNLVKNAIKFTPAGGSVTVTTHNPEAGCIALAVADSGIGIDAAQMPRLFNAFEQGGRAVTQKFGGLGLGLAISKALVQLHHGQISAASAGTGQGATFTVVLGTDGRPDPVDPAPAPADHGELTCAILLVEDHADTRQIMEYALKDLGCTVSSAGTVAGALALAAERRFDLLISDIGLPDAPGTVLMRELKARHALKGIAMSGYGRDGDLEQSREAGFDAHLVKPVTLDALEEAIRRLLG